ncbi:MAG TPA: hypothetical protein DIW77_14875 [Chromatiaceae bacterium]|nr:hypothetical protein [Chromatiaceae bacterium]
MSWDELILLRDRLNATLQDIRTTRQIKTPSDVLPEMQRAAPITATDNIGTSDDSCAWPAQCCQ